MSTVRLDKLLSDNGYSRKEAGTLIKHGCVAVNGTAVKDPSAKLEREKLTSVSVNGKKLRLSEQLHLMVYKPAGVLTATEDGRDATVIDMLPKEFRNIGLGPVGRLDKDVTGLVLLTTDGQLAHRLISPRWEQFKHYTAVCEGIIDEDDIRKMKEGIPLKDFTCKGADMVLLETDAEKNECTVDVAVCEGKYHQVKRMLGALGHSVIRLHRRSIAGIELDKDLSEGGWRELTADETAYLYRITEMTEA